MSSLSGIFQTHNFLLLFPFRKLRFCCQIFDHVADFDDANGAMNKLT